MMSIATPIDEKRSDTVDLIGPEFDYPSSDPASRTLIICAAPRTGSYELCRHLAAAGIGVPHEYFNNRYASTLAARWGFTNDPLGETELPRYIDILRRRRAQGGVFSVKLQFRHIDRYLRNRFGAALFAGACIVHLFRPDVAGQYASFRAAVESGRWDFNARQTSKPRTRERQNSEKYVREAVSEVNRIISEDTGFRGLFVLLNIRPIFVTSDELFRDPRAIVRQIAQAVGVLVREDALEHSISRSAPYGHTQQRENAIMGLADAFRKLAFQPRQIVPR